MHHNVAHHVLALAESLGTYGAGVGFLLRMCFVVPPKVLRPRKVGATLDHLAHVWSVPRVHSDVYVHRPLLVEHNASFFALVSDIAL